MVTGRYDQVTPPSYGRRVARRLSRSRLLTLPVGHSPIIQTACGVALLTRFVADPQRRLVLPAACRTAERASATSGLPGDGLAGSGLPGPRPPRGLVLGG